MPDLPPSVMAQAEQARKLTPAESIGKVLMAFAELIEKLEAIEATQTEVKAALREIYKRVSAIEVKTDALAECVARHEKQ